MYHYTTLRTPQTSCIRLQQICNRQSVQLGSIFFCLYLKWLSNCVNDIMITRKHTLHMNTLDKQMHTYIVYGIVPTEKEEYAYILIKLITGNLLFKPHINVDSNIDWSEKIALLVVLKGSSLLSLRGDNNQIQQTR